MRKNKSYSSRVNPVPKGDNPRIFKSGEWSTDILNKEKPVNNHHANIHDCGCDDCMTQEKIWTVGKVSILAGLTLFAGIGLWRIIEIICGLI